MNLNEAFPSKYLKAADLGGRDVRLDMDYVEMCEMHGQEDEKPVLCFTNCTRGLVLNKTNATTIGDTYGSETDTWSGRPIVLFAAKTQFGSKQVDCIRVRAPENDTDGLTDDIPF